MLNLPTNISVVIITKNEASNIKFCIESCQSICSDIIIVDSLSTDDTVNIARNCGASVYQKEWEGYGAAKNFGAEKANHDWVLSIDADERLNDELITALREIDLEKNTLYGFRRLNFIGKRSIRFGDWNPDIKYRLYHKEKTEWNQDQVHEKLLDEHYKKKIVLNGRLLHYSFSDVRDLRQKLNHYAKLGAEQMAATAPSSVKLGRIKPFFRFFKSYVLKAGFLDGKIGYEIAKANAEAQKLKFDYLKEMLKER